jgi:hypothetical protein
MKYNSFLNSNRQEVEKGVVLVIGKHMNRTALGIVDAILTVYPKATFAELKEMLPDSINPSAPKNYKSLFAPYNPNRHYGVIQPGSIKEEALAKGLDINASHFTEKGETFSTSDGVEVLVSKSWESSDTLTGENDLQKLINHVKQFGIQVNTLEPTTTPFKKGTYELYILNEQLYSKLINYKKNQLLYLWVIMIIIILLLGVGYMLTK